MFWKLILVLDFFILAPIAFSQSMPDYDRGSRSGFCDLSYKINSSSKSFDYDYEASKWCDQFGKFSGSCRFSKNDKGKYRSKFFHSGNFKGRTYWHSFNSYFAFMRDNGFFRDRFAHSYRLKDCYEEKRRPRRPRPDRRRY